MKENLSISVKIDDVFVFCGYFSLYNNQGMFKYDDAYLENSKAYPLDPINLPLSKTPYITNINKGYFGVFYDMMPQGWNRYILEKNNETISLKKHFITNNLIQINNINIQKSYLQENQLADYIKYIVKAYNPKNEKEEIEAENVTIVSPIGGFRPKIMVQYDNRFWIAKFSKFSDNYNMPLVEHAMSTLAKKCGIDVPNTMVKQYGDDFVFFSEFFVKEHIFLSGGTLLKRDAEADFPDKSYNYEDLYKLSSSKDFFKRILFSVATKNLDDHVWNIGYLFDGSELELSPMYDMMPFSSDECVLNGYVNNMNRFHDLNELLACCNSFNIDVNECLETIAILQKWKEHFTECGVDISDIAYLIDSFTLVDSFVNEEQS